MARRTVRIEIPTSNPDDFSKLLNGIAKEDAKLGDESPLKNDKDIDMPDFVAKLAQADSLREESERLRNKSEDLMQQARVIYGTAAGQTINTPGTLYFIQDIIKRALLKTYKGKEDALANFSYKVVIG